ncbi:hypothetical protein Tco_0001635 [Tanacetum coccineum]
MDFVDHSMKDLQDIDFCLVMARQLRCETSIEDLKHSLPWLCKVLGEERTYFLNGSLIAKNLEKWLDVIKIRWWNEWLFRSFHKKLESCTEHVHSVCDLLSIYHETDCLISIWNLPDYLPELLNVHSWNINSSSQRIA